MYVLISLLIHTLRNLLNRGVYNLPMANCELKVQYSVHSPADDKSKIHDVIVHILRIKCVLIN